MKKLQTPAEQLAEELIINYGKNWSYDEVRVEVADRLTELNLQGLSVPEFAEDVLDLIESARVIVKFGGR